MRRASLPLKLRASAPDSRAGTVAAAPIVPGQTRGIRLS
ncbi:hypothetical protein BMA721280_A0733 [Burkholderia mallei 2002721280]|nr:hypothetical protein BMA721280_A0733 [Burkholderia mallei 2002721280]EEC35696.1 hypothetical protein BUC_1886 [Burkholderia pseudomallei 576]